jgi:UDP-glucose 4-epimerase
MRVLVTGAAGFVGSHAARSLHASGHEVVATDVVAARSAVRIADLLRSGVRYVAGDLADTLPEAMPGVREVWHFAANADIPLGIRDTIVDLRESPLLTQRILEHMRTAGATTILFPSTSGVYGNGLGPVVRESDGPLLPVSLYAAGKLACEGLISAYGHMFGIRGMLFRLGNVVGGAMGRGIVRDFIAKLSADSRTLQILGDGRQRKSYVLVDDIIAGMTWIRDHPAGTGPTEVYNLAAGDSLDVTGVAAAVAAAMGLTMPDVVADAGRPLSWAGDQPVVELGIERAMSTGWRPVMGAAQAVETAARRLMDEQANGDGTKAGAQANGLAHELEVA